MGIHIKKDPVGERYLSPELSKDDYLISNIMHISDVQKGCAFIANKIIEAGIKHDYTKITLIDEFMDDAVTIPRAEFSKGEWFQAHVSGERHHLNNYCPDDVTLIDVIEKLVDVTMSAMARKGKMRPDIISDAILQKAYQNTIEMLKKEIVIDDDK